MLSFLINKLFEIWMLLVVFNNLQVIGGKWFGNMLSFMVHDHRWFFGMFFIFYLVALQTRTLGHYGGDSLTHTRLITAYFIILQSKGHQEPRNKVDSLSLAELPVGFELLIPSSLGLNPPSLSPQIRVSKNTSCHSWNLPPHS